MSGKGNFEKDEWELYHVDEDRSEIHNLAQQFPEMVMEMRVRWFVEATKYNVLPLDDRGVTRISDLYAKPKVIHSRTKYVYYPDTAEIPESIASNVKNTPHTITADVVIPEGGAEGVLLAQGSRFAGYSLFVKDRRLVYTYNYVGTAEYRIASNVDVPTGNVKLGFEFALTGPPDIPHGKGAPGIGRLLINDKVVGEGQIPVTVPITFSLIGEGLCCGRDDGASVTSEYRSPFKFTGKIKRVVVKVGGEPKFDPQAELKRILATV